MKKYQSRFDMLRVGAEFSQNGTSYRKKSTRTAVITGDNPGSGRWFYFRNAEQCTFTNPHRALA